MDEENRYYQRRRFLESNGAYNNMHYAPRGVRIHVPLIGSAQIDYAIKQWSQVSFMISSIEDTGLDGKLRSFGIILREMHCRLADNARRNNISHEHGAIGVPDSARVVIPLLSTKHFNNAKSEIKLLSAYYKKIPKKTTLKQKQYDVYGSLRCLSWQLKTLADDSNQMPYNPSYDFRGIK